MHLNNPDRNSSDKPPGYVTGRPTLYKPEYCQQIIDFMSDGSALCEFAKHIGVSKQTVYEWGNVHPEFSDSIKTAMTACEAWWSVAGRQGMRTSGPFSAATWIFNMKARFKWQDQVNVEMKADVQTEDKKDQRTNEVLAALKTQLEFQSDPTK